MMKRLLFGFAATAAFAVAACDTAPRDQIGLVGPVVVFDTAFRALQLVITPNFVQVDAGSLVQLSTNAPDTLFSQVRWESRNPLIATVSPTGLVTTLTPGTATISAHYTFDPLNIAFATVTVTSVGNP